MLFWDVLINQQLDFNGDPCLRIAQISQIKDLVISLGDKFVNFKICTENKLAEMVNNQAFQDKLDTMSQS